MYSYIFSQICQTQCRTLVSGGHRAEVFLVDLRPVSPAGPRSPGDVPERRSAPGPSAVRIRWLGGRCGLRGGESAAVLAVHRRRRRLRVLLLAVPSGVVPAAGMGHRLVGTNRDRGAAYRRGARPGRERAERRGARDRRRHRFHRGRYEREGAGDAPPVRRVLHRHSGMAASAKGGLTRQKGDHGNAPPSDSTAAHGVSQVVL